MSTVTLDSTAEALKTLYLPGLQWQIDYASEIAGLIEKTSKNVEGNKIKFAAGYGAVAGIGARSDAGPLPTPGPRKTLQFEIETRNIFTTVKLNDKLIETAKHDARSYINWFADYMEHVEEDLKKDVARQYQGDGSGLIATISAVTYAAGPPKTLTLTLNDVTFFEEGMRLDIINKSATPDALLAGAEALEVTLVDEENLQIVVSGIASDISGDIQVANDYLVRSGSLTYELTGFAAVFTPDNTLYGKNRALYKWFNPTVYACNGELTQLKLQAALEKCRKKTGSNIDAFVTTEGVRRGFQAHMQAFVSILDTKVLDGGYRVLAYNGLPFTADIFHPAGTLRGLNLSTWNLCRQSPFNWSDLDGSIWHRTSDNTPTWEAWGREYCDLVCFAPRKNFTMTGITEH